MPPGNIYSIGQGTEGQLLNGANSDQDSTWQTVTTLQGQTIYKIHGQGYQVLIHASGGIYVGGHGTSGRLGIGNNNNQNTLVKNTTLSALSIYKIAFGNYTSYAITTDGKGYAWGGDNANSIPTPLSGNQSTPVEASSLTNLPLVLQNPSFDFDGYNKLSISGITPTSTTLKYGSNTYDIGTKTDIYIKDAGTYDIETKNATKFALRSNVVGTVNAR
ncbi:MAG: hypothetical protein Ct9H90mV1_1600 [Prasinovirus sp.]|nr:MAG: hypothetical protein Ct9H90mV1_1600 [Prasinovirus sp.]